MTDSTNPELSQVLRHRREKLASLEAEGIEPYAYRFDRTHRSDAAAGGLRGG
jgi:lysyl-tRNA synthetase class II